MGGSLRVRINLEQAVRNIFFGKQYTGENYRRLYYIARLLYPEVFSNIKRGQCPFCKKKFSSSRGVIIHLMASYDCKAKLNKCIDTVIEMYRKYVRQIESRRRKKGTYYYVPTPYGKLRFTDIREAIKYAIYRGEKQAIWQKTLKEMMENA